MPFRRRGPPVPPSPPEAPALSDSDEEFEDGGPVEGEEEEEEELLEEEMGEMEEMGDDEEEELLASPPPSPSQLTSHLPPPNFREISTLASWTVSSSKPGCSIPQLRHPSTNQFWQSDGPQPHYLNIHFFKLVRIVGLRLYLDFEADESYTPTRIVLLAGSGMNDLVEWGEMRLESPRGWIWADFEGVGDGESDGEDESDEDEVDEGGNGGRLLGVHETPARGARVMGQNIDDGASDFENTAPQPAIQDFIALANDPMILDPAPPPPLPVGRQMNAHLGTPTLPRPHPRHPFTPLTANMAHPSPQRTKKKPKIPVLRCHLVQIKILENHQNGKDTHLRGLQIFAMDGEKESAETARGKGIVRQRGGEGMNGATNGGGKGVEVKKKAVKGLMKSSWMGEASLR